MRKLIVISVCLLAAAAWSAVTGDTAFEIEKDDQVERLHVNVRLHGISRGEVFKYEFRWTAPDGGLLVWPDKSGPTSERCFADSKYSPEKPAGDTVCAACRPYCADSKEKGCWRTRAYRTIQYVHFTPKGTKVLIRGVGEWKVEVVRLDTGETIAEGSYTVE